MASIAETLEVKRLLTITISSNTTWSEDQTITENVIVQNGAILTIASGVTVVSGFYHLKVNQGGTLIGNDVNFDVAIDIGGNNGAGTFNANGSTFSENVTFDTGSVGTVQNGIVTDGLFIFEDGANPTISGMNFQPLNAVESVGEFIPHLENNTFAVNSQINVLQSTVDQASQWAVNNVETYKLKKNVTVNSSTLTIASGVTVGTFSSLYHLKVNQGGTLIGNDVNFDVELDIGGNNGAGTFNANGSTFSENVTFDTGSVGTVQNGIVTDGLFIFEDGANPTISGMNFQPLNAVESVGEFIPHLENNTFAVNSQINVLQSTVDQASQWAVNNVETYKLKKNVTVNSSTLTIASGVTVGTFSSLYHLKVNQGGTLIGNDVNFDVELDIGGNNGAGTLEACNSLFTYLLLDQNSSGVLRYNRFVDELLIDGFSQASIQDNDFSGVVRVELLRNTSEEFDLRNNWWGTTDTNIIEDKILHDTDDSSRPLAIFSPLLTSLPVKSNEVYTVNTFSDIVDPNDNALSLREAILAANTDCVDSTVVLGDGIYLLSLNGSGEDNSASGDLDILNDGSFTLIGNSAENTKIDAGGDSGL
ncbi:CSLREA domain-containing protein, partial [uncultured Rubinisphaera sp.]|uniref:CSLREA domain-containing protein n=1 Tax=uncultured Rubinisphaera sp. TaxID=1678686 RepID=UPI0030D7E18D